MSPLARFARMARARDIILPEPAARRAPSLAKAFARPGILAELKPASPTEGRIRDLSDAAPLARALVQAGAAGLSALTEPEEFLGGPHLLAAAVASGGPVLMKDFVVTERQLDLAQRAGASGVLLILDLLDAKSSDWQGPQEAVAAAHARGLEVLLEVYDEEGFEQALGLDADLLGVNNRDLRLAGLPVDNQRTARILRSTPGCPVPVLALSGAKDAADVRAQVASGARGVLVGTALMKADDPVKKLMELREGLA